MSGVANKSKIDAALKSFRAIGMEALNESARGRLMGIVDQLAMPVQSRTSQEGYGWAQGIPNMELWVGDRPTRTLDTNAFTITNQPYATGVSVKRDDIEDDTIGIYGPAIKDMVEEAFRHKYRLLRDLLNNATSDTGYDGVAFAATTHPRRSGTDFSNLVSGALSETTYATADAALSEAKNYDDTELGLVATHLIVSSSLKFAARKIVNAGTVATGGENVHAEDGVRVLVLPGMTAGSWALADLSRSVKPFVHQKRRDVAFTQLDKETDDRLYWKNEYNYGVDYRGAMAYGLFELIQYSTGS